MRRSVVSLVAISVFALALLPTGPTRDPAGAAEPLRLTVGSLGSIGSLDPRRGFSEIAREVWKLQYPTLTSLDPKTLDTAPGVAVSWSPGPGGKGWIYKVRPGLTWSDGQPVTANDVVYSIERPRIGTWLYPNHPSGLSFVTGLHAVALDARTVQVTPSDIDGTVPGLLIHVVPAHVFSEVRDLDANLGPLGVSGGAWHVTARTRDSVQLDAIGPNGPALQQIVFRTYPSANALIDALAHQQVDVVSGLPAADVDRLSALANVTVNHAGDGHQFILRDKLDNEKLRQAISLAIDRTALVTDTVHGVGSPGVVPTIAFGKTWALDDSTVQSLTASLDAQRQRARRLVAEVPESQRDFTLYTSFGNPPAQKVAESVRGALETVGLNARVMDHDENDSAYDLLLYNNTFTDNPFHPSSTLDLMTEGARAQHLPSTDYTELVDLTRDRLQRLTEEAKVVGLFEPDVLQAFRTDNVTGFLRDPEIRSLVVFGPTVAQYSQLAAAPPPPGEQLSNTAYAVGAAIVLAACIAAFLFAAWIRRRFVRNEGAA